MSEEKVTNSSLIQSYTYDQESKTLSIVYKSNGAQWDYKGVPPSVVDSVFNSSGSIGTKFHSLIKRQYKATLTP